MFLRLIIPRMDYTGVISALTFSCFKESEQIHPALKEALGLLKLRQARHQENVLQCLSLIMISKLENIEFRFITCCQLQSVYLTLGDV